VHSHVCVRLHVCVHAGWCKPLTPARTATITATSVPLHSSVHSGKETGKKGLTGQNGLTEAKAAPKTTFGLICSLYNRHLSPCQPTHVNVGSLLCNNSRQINHGSFRHLGICNLHTSLTSTSYYLSIVILNIVIDTIYPYL